MTSSPSVVEPAETSEITTKQIVDITLTTVTPMESMLNDHRTFTGKHHAPYTLQPDLKMAPTAIFSR